MAQLAILKAEKRKSEQAMKDSKPERRDKGLIEEARKQRECQQRIEEVIRAREKQTRGPAQRGQLQA